MKKLYIKNIDGYNYTLTNNDKDYNLNIEFYNLKDKPVINDIIYMNDNILKDKVLNFEVLNNNDLIVLKEIIIIEHNNNKIYLRIVYG